LAGGTVVTDKLGFPLYHGTSTLFLDSIVEHGLGGRNPVEDLRVIEFANELWPLVKTHLASEESWILKAESFRRMIEQKSGLFNFQHGDTYVSPSMPTAIRYAASSKYGSEIISYALALLSELEVRNVDGVRTDLFRRFPRIFGLLDVSPAPLILVMHHVTRASLITESGGDPSLAVAEIIEIKNTNPEIYELICQQKNFRIKAPIPVESIQVQLLNVTEFDPYSPKYTLYRLST
jgi:hypothetical protein